MGPTKRYRADRMDAATTTEQRINTLPPGRSLRLSGDTACWCTVERSGDGQWLRYVRHTPRGFKVFKRERF
jgi:hypothetical protein